MQRENILENSFENTTFRGERETTSVWEEERWVERKKATHSEMAECFSSVR